MLDTASLKILLAAALAVFVLFVMSRRGGKDGFAPFAWYGRDSADIPARWDDDGNPTVANRPARGDTSWGRPTMTKDGFEPAPAVGSGAALMAAQQAVPMAPLAASTDLLPKASADAGFAQFAPDPAALTGQNFVDASRWVSQGTLGTHRNANYQLRADVPIPKNNQVSPWMQSTIEQDTYRKPLES